MPLFCLLLTALFLAAPVRAAEPYDCGPFLLQPGPDRMTIVVDHEHPVEAILVYRPDAGGKAREIRRREAQRHHIFELEGLEADTAYRYRVKSGKKLDSGEHVFRTLPAAPERYRLIALGDVRSLPDVWHKVSERVFEEEQDALFIIGTGDYPADGSKYHQWIEQFFRPGRNLLGRLPIWPAIGNHERTRGSGDPREKESHFFSLFELPGNERWYRVDYGYTTLLVVDSNTTMEPGEPQYEWLREELRAPRRRFTLVAFHHAPFTSGPHASLEDDGTPDEWPLDHGRRFLVPLFEMYGVDLVLNGHDHLYERSYKDGVYYVVSGGGGAPLYRVNSVENPYQQVAVSTNHYVTLDVESAAITLTAIDADGQIIDWFKVPLASAAVGRIHRAAAKRLDGALGLEAIDLEAKTAELSIENVLERPVEISLEVPEGGGARLALGPGESRRIPLDLESYLPTEERPAWRGGVYAEIGLDVRGDAGGVPLEIRLDRRLTLAEPGYEAPRMEPPQVDGDLEEWDGVEPMWLDSRSALIDGPEAYRGEDDFRAAVRMGWSEGALHLAIEVADDDVLDDPSRSIWLTDSIELFLDGRPEADRVDAYGRWVSQNIVPVERPVDGRFVGNGSWEKDAFEWKISRGDSGYVLEASIPFALIREEGRVEAGEQVRFDLIINDQDARDKNQSRHTLWSSASASRHTDDYGVIWLK